MLANAYLADPGRPFLKGEIGGVRFSSSLEWEGKMNRYGDPKYWDCGRCGAENSTVDDMVCKFCGAPIVGLPYGSDPQPVSQPHIVRRPEDRPPV